MAEKALWVAPSLCGCALAITADWLPGDVIDGVSYRHPKAFTITAIEVSSVCEAHAKAQYEMADTSSFFAAPEPGSYHDHLNRQAGVIPGPAQLVQTRGYLKYPIDNPPPAENLYTALYFHGGQVHGLPCGCKAYQHIDRSQPGTPLLSWYKKHPLHTAKCFRHTGDSDDMARARADHDAVLAQLRICAA